MSKEHTQRVRELFLEVLDRPHDEQQALLNQVCAGEASLRAQVDKLLRAHQGANDFLEPVSRSDTQTARSASARDLAGRRIGPYEVLEQIGAGGMGAVYRAQQLEPIRREVALKVIKWGMDSDQVVARFESERQALALMDHSNIARVFDAGATETGRPYFVMEHVRGEPITAYCDRRRLTTRQRLELFTRVCHGVQHAHQKAIIHRDLKPSNVLVTLSDAEAIPKIIDFGVAKATEQKLTERTLFTEDGQLIGTPEYMSPEQAELTAENIDTRTDIYSLGVILYELLVGTLPFDPARLRQASFAEIQRIIRDEPTPRPSARLSTLDEQQSATAAAQRRADPSSLRRELSGDLDWITLTAMDKDRARRYETAAALADDVSRYLRHEPVAARPPSARYRMSKFLRRNKGPVAAAVALVVVLLAATSVSIGFAFGEARQRELAEKRQKETEQVAEFQESRLAGVNAREMGDRLRDDLIARVRDALELDGQDEAHINSDVLDLEQLLHRVNFTDVANKSLAESICQPTLQAIEERFAEQPLVRAQLLQSIARVASSVQMLDLAAISQEQALQIRRRELGDTHPETLRSFSSTAGILIEQGKWADAETLRRQALASARRELGSEHRLTLQLMDSLGSVLGGRGKYAESAEFQSEALEIARRVLHEDDPLVPDLMLKLAHSIGLLGRHVEAEVLYREVLQIRRRILGNGHAHTLWAAQRLGICLRAQGQLEEAEPYIREAVEGYRRTRGDEAEATLGAMHHLSILLSEMGKYEEAERLSARTVRYGRNLWTGERPPFSAWFLTRHAQTLIALQYFERAEAELLEAEALLEDHDRTIRNPDFFRNFAIYLAEVLTNLYDSWHAAEPGAGHDANLAERREKLELMMSLNGNFTFSLGLLDAPEAHKPYRELLKLQRRILGNEDRSMLWAAERLGVSLQWQGKFEEARPYLCDVLESCRRIKGDEHPETLVATLQLSKLLSDVGEHERAERLAAEAVRHGRAVLPGERPYGAAMFLARHAATLRALKRFEAAEAELLEAQALFEEPDVPISGPELYRKFTVGLTEELADLYDAWHSAKPGAGYDAKAAECRAKLEIEQHDTDGDGVVDPVDPCPYSDLSEAISIGGYDTDVANLMVNTSGCKMSDLITQCAENATDQGSFESCVVALAYQWKGDGLIKPDDIGRIQRCAAQAQILDWNPMTIDVQRIQQLVEEHNRQMMEW